MERSPINRVFCGTFSNLQPNRVMLAYSEVKKVVLFSLCARV